MRKLRYKQSKAQRETLAAEVRKLVFSRLLEVSGGEFNATFGSENIKRKPEHNLKYCITPVTDLIEQYNKLVDDAQAEIEDLRADMPRSARRRD